MKRFMIILAALAISSLAAADEISFNLDRCVMIDIPGDQISTPRLALDFDIPSELDNQEIMYAELTFTIPALRLRSDSLLEICLFPFFSEWSEDDIDNMDLEAVTDSMNAGCFTVKMEEANRFQIDLTSFFRSVIEGEIPNYGFIAIPELLNAPSIEFPEVLDEQLLDLAVVKVVYK